MRQVLVLMAQDDLTQLIATIRLLEDTRDLWQTALDFYHNHGIVQVSYQVYGEEHAYIDWPDLPDEAFPHNRKSDLIKDSFALIDPIPDLARQQSRPFWWSQIETLKPISDETRQRLDAFRARSVGDGLAMQVFGPNLRNAYVGLGYGEPRPELSDLSVALLQMASQAMHLRYCELTDTAILADVTLSPRELEVLKWIALGKSNTVISELIGLSRHTVDTLVRRLFSKLEVTDRTTAAIKAIGAGFLHKGEFPD